MLPNAQRVQQHNWDSPNRADWVATLDAAIAALDGPAIIVAHSLGCALTAWWASQHGGAPYAANIKGALLVAPPDVERADFPVFASGFAPMPHTALPFNTIVVASSDDPWCALPRAKAWAAAWGAQCHDIGPCGHINDKSGLADWPEGRAWLSVLTQRAFADYPERKI